MPNRINNLLATALTSFWNYFLRAASVLPRAQMIKPKLNRSGFVELLVTEKVLHGNTMYRQDFCQTF